MKPPYRKRWWHELFELSDLVVVAVLFAVALVCLAKAAKQTYDRPAASHSPAIDPEERPSSRARAPPGGRLPRALVVPAALSGSFVMKPQTETHSPPLVLRSPCAVCGGRSQRSISRKGALSSASADGLVFDTECADICDAHLPANYAALPLGQRHEAVANVWIQLDYIVWQRPPRVLLRRQTVRSKLVCLSRFAQWRKRLRRAFAFYVAAPHGESPVK